MKIDIHVTGLGFPEGPVPLPDGSIAFVDLTHRKIRQFKDGICTELCELPGAPNGMRLGPDGSLMICNNGGIGPENPNTLKFSEPLITGRLQKVLLDGNWRDFATELPGLKPSRPNDLVFASSGEVVFTDPQNWEVLGNPATKHTYHGGQLLLARHNGDVEHLAKIDGFPNGLAFHPDGSLLVGVTIEQRILRFPWHGGSVGEPTEWCRLPAPFGPDGMIFDEDRLFVTGSVGDRVAVVSLDGSIVDMIETGVGSDPTNCCVAHGRLWLTLGYKGQLVSLVI